MKKIFLLYILFVFSGMSAQNNKLEELRKLYNKGNFKIYQDNIKLSEKREELPPPSPQQKDKRKNKLIKLFNIPLNERINLYPFNLFDSIYVVMPNYIENIDEPRNYLEQKYHNEGRLISNDEKNKLSDVLFNYYKLTYNNELGSYNKYGCECIEKEFPKMILLFKKNGKFEKFLAIPTEIYNRWNFSNDEIAFFDLSKEKEELILKLFKIKEPEYTKKNVLIPVIIPEVDDKKE